MNAVVLGSSPPCLNCCSLQLAPLCTARRRAIPSPHAHTLLHAAAAAAAVQAQAAHKELCRQLERHVHLGAVLWLSSPLSRAMETMLLAYPDLAHLASGRVPPVASGSSGGGSGGAAAEAAAGGRQRVGDSDGVVSVPSLPSHHRVLVLRCANMPPYFCIVCFAYY